MSNLATSFAESFIVSQASNLTSGITRAAIYEGNRLLPNNVISLESHVRNLRFNTATAAGLKNNALSQGFAFVGADLRQYKLTSPGPIGATFPIQKNNNYAVGEYSQKEWELVWGQYRPNIGEVLQLQNRQLITPQLAQEFIYLETQGDRPLARAFQELRFEIPGPSDLVRFAVREAFTPEIVDAYSYNKEFPSYLLPFMEQQGYGKQLGFPTGANATNFEGTPDNRPATWSDLYWWSHWNLPSVSQGYEMLRRLYVFSTYGQSPDSARSGEEFTARDMEQLLKVSDYPEYWRKKLIAIQYLPYQKRDIQRLYQNGIFTLEDVYHAFRANGYDDNRANVLTELMRVLPKPKERSKKLQAKTTLCKYYTHGLIDVAQAIDWADKLGLDKESIEFTLSLCDVEQKLEDQKEIVRSLRRGYFNGTFTTEEIRTGFHQANMDTKFIERTISKWKLQLGYRFKYVSGAKVIAWFKQGLINESEVTTRMLNLGFFPVDISNSIREAKLAMLLTQQKQIAKRQKEELSAISKQQKEQQKLLAKEQKAAIKKATADQKALEKKMSRMLAAFTESNIKTWAKAKIIDVETVLHILYLKGWNEQATQALLIELGFIPHNGGVVKQGDGYAISKA